MAGSVDRLLLVSVFLGFVTFAMSGMQEITVEFDLNVRQGEFPDKCEPLRQQKPDYWTRRRFSECQLVADEDQTRTFTVQVDLTKIQSDHSALTEGFFEWVINRQLNLGSNKCATLVGKPNMPSSSSTFSVAYPENDAVTFSEKLGQNLPEGITVFSFTITQTSAQTIHGETVQLAMVTLSGPISSPQYLKTLRKINTGPRCWYNMFAK